MRVKPFYEVDGIAFGASRSTIASQKGEPDRVSKSRSGKDELHYENVIFRFRVEASGVSEITVASEYLEIERVEVSFAELGFWVAKEDIDSYQAHGFIVSPKFGFLFDANQPSFVTLFSEKEALPLR